MPTKSPPTSPLPPPSYPCTLIEPTKGWAPIRLKELWQSRELIYFLTLRDIQVRYKQTVLGAAWAILQPFATMVVFTIFFGKLAKIGSDGLPYPIFSYSGLLPWTFVSIAMAQIANSLQVSSNLIKKVYFPRLSLAVAPVAAALVDLALAFSILIFMQLHYDIIPSLNLIYLPLFLGLACLTALGVGLLLAALNVAFRDVRYIIPFLTNIWLFVSPVIVPTSKVTAKLEEVGLPGWLYGLNPMVGVVDGFRWALLDAPLDPSMVLVSAFTSCVLFYLGVMAFRRQERFLADVL